QFILDGVVQSLREIAIDASTRTGGDQLTWKIRLTGRNIPPGEQTRMYSYGLSMIGRWTAEDGELRLGPVEVSGRSIDIELFAAQNKVAHKLVDGVASAILKQWIRSP